ncbi:MAG TPA: rhomboid family intramembrane serine protease [Candidatus Limnocylindrales bacterium]
MDEPREPGQAEAAETPPTIPEIATEGPLSRDTARAILGRATELLDGGDFAESAVHFQRVVGFDDAAITAEALLGLGQALYRLDEEDAAVARWEAILELPETPSTYRAWREVAAARVRDGDLGGAMTAYREADRRAPAEDKPEIANRLGWLAKETGNTRAAGRYFARGRGSGPALPLSWIVIATTVVVSFAAMSPDGASILRALMLNKVAVADGEYWRLWTVTLVHDPSNILHLAFNMYALYITGPLVEQLYGSRLFGLFYLLCAAAGSVASFVFGAGALAVGASGAIFGLFGILFAASRTHNPLIDRRARMLVGQIGTIIAINLVIGFSGVLRIDNAAHVGGLVAGLWLGFLIVPGRVPTLSSLWQRPTTLSSDAAKGATMLLPALGVAGLVGVLVIGVVAGTGTWQGVRTADDPAAGRSELFVDPSDVFEAIDPGPLADEAAATHEAIAITRAIFPESDVRVDEIRRGPLSRFCDATCRSLSGGPAADAEVWDVSLTVAFPDRSIDNHVDLEVETGTLLVLWTDPPLGGAP